MHINTPTNQPTNQPTFPPLLEIAGDIQSGTVTLFGATHFLAAQPYFSGLWDQNHLTRRIYKSLMDFMYRIWGNKFSPFELSLTLLYTHAVSSFQLLASVATISKHLSLNVSKQKVQNITDLARDLQVTPFWGIRPVVGRFSCSNNTNSKGITHD